MAKSKVRVVGITRGISKKGNEFCMLHVNKPLLEAQSKAGGIGLIACSYFVGGDLKEKVTNNLVNKDITINTYFAGNQDNLVDIEL